jgi:hypothetical protein
VNRQPNPVTRQILFVTCLCVVGCGGRDHLAQIKKQEKEIERLNGLLKDSDERLAVASRQLQASVDHASDVMRARDAAERACDETKQRAAEDSKRLKGQCDAVESVLLHTRRQLAELERRSRETAQPLAPNGAWVLDGDPIFRFLFFANGTGVFQRWDGDSWIAGEQKVGIGGDQPMLSNGTFVFRPSGAHGTFELRFIRSRERIDYQRTHGEFLGKMEAVEKREEKAVDVTVVMKTPDAARLVGWRAKDAVARRVEESWTPKAVKE